MAILETDLAQRIKPLLEKEYRVFEEIAVLNRSIDMVLVNDSAVISVELKIRDWRKAILQIRGHLVASDYGYLCMPKRKISHELSTLLQAYGIGLWLYDWDHNNLIRAVEPKKSQIQWGFYRNMLLARTTERGHGL